MLTVRKRWCFVLLVPLLLAGCGGAPREQSAAARQVALPRADSALSDVRAQANQLLAGGPDRFDAWIKALEGQPIVVNQWASWCGHCRFEFPFFERQARELGDRVAFLGVNSKDSESAAASFLERHPVPFPHFSDPDAEMARRFRGGRSWPTTAFYRASGELAFTHQGSYATEQDLAADIRRYALGD